MVGLCLVLALFNYNPECEVFIRNTISDLKAKMTSVINKLDIFFHNAPEIDDNVNKNDNDGDVNNGKDNVNDNNNDHDNDDKNDNDYDNYIDTNIDDKILTMSESILSIFSFLYL